MDKMYASRADPEKWAMQEVQDAYAAACFDAMIISHRTFVAPFLEIFLWK